MVDDVFSTAQRVIFFNTDTSNWTEYIETLLLLTRSVAFSTVLPPHYKSDKNNHDVITFIHWIIRLINTVCLHLGLSQTKLFEPAPDWTYYWTQSALNLVMNNNVLTYW